MTPEMPVEAVADPVARPVTERVERVAEPARRVDVVVVGAGPAGLACAASLLDATALSVTVVDAGHRPGGQYWRHPAHTGAGSALSGGSPAHHGSSDLATFRALVARLEAGRAAGQLSFKHEHHAWTVVEAEGGYEVHAVDRSSGPGRDRAVRLRCRALVIATGAYDRSLPFPGWDLPGVMTAGGLQALLKGGGVAAGPRVAVGGSGPFLLPVAAGLARAGAEVVGVFEANRRRRWLRELRPVVANVPKLTEGAGYMADLVRHRVPMHTGRMVVAAHGIDRLESISVARVDAAGNPDLSRLRRYEVDALGVGWGFTPQLDLAVTLGLQLVPGGDGTRHVSVDDLQHSSRPGVLAAGETTGVGGAALAVAEGTLVAVGIARYLAHDPHVSGRAPHLLDERRIAALRRSIQRMREFGAAIERAHPVPSGWRAVLQPDTTVCRCEEVPWAQVRIAIDQQGARDARQVKQLTRTGMGWCQGRVCDYAAGLLAAGQVGAPAERLVSAPLTLGCLATLDAPDPPEPHHPSHPRPL